MHITGYIDDIYYIEDDKETVMFKVEDDNGSNFDSIELPAYLFKNVEIEARYRLNIVEILKVDRVRDFDK